MDSKVCTKYNLEEMLKVCTTNIQFVKFRIVRSLKRYYENKDKLSNQRKLDYQKKQR